MEVLAPTAAKASLSSAVAASPLRSDVPRRLQDLTALELLAKLTVEHAGAIFLGIQLGSTKNGERQPTLVLFSSPNTPTPLALSIYDVSTPAEMSREGRRWQWTVVIALAIFVLAMLLKFLLNWLGNKP